MSLKNVNLFEAEALSLKISSFVKIPYDTKGRCTLVNIKPCHYDWQIISTEGKSNKSFKFIVDKATDIIVKTRGKTFHVTIKKSGGPTQLYGTLKQEEDVSRLEKIFNYIKHTDYSLNQIKDKVNRTPLGIKNVQGNQGSFRENHCLREIDTANKSPLSSKKPLSSSLNFGSVGTKGKYIFPASSELSSETPIKKKKENCDKDETVFAKSSKKPFQFYKSSKFKYLDKSSMSISRKGIFQQRKESLNMEMNLRQSTKEANNNNNIVGFSNLGNTCYMNAILQCLLNLPCFFQDMNNKDNVNRVSHDSLYESLCLLGILKYSYEPYNNQRFALQRVKKAISSTSKRFRGYAQHDAHEFLCQCLDQLKDDLLGSNIDEEKRMLVTPSTDNQIDTNTLCQNDANTLCPIKRNFESIIKHKIICNQCNETVQKEEVCHDFSLVIPEYDENTNPCDITVVNLLNLYFKNEVIEYSCEKCTGKISTLWHEFSKLPRLIILHLKRYDIYDTKRTDKIILPQEIDMSSYSASNVSLPLKFDYNKQVFKDRIYPPEKRKSNEKIETEPKSKVSKNNTFKSYDNINEDNLLSDNDFMNGVAELEKNEQNEFTKIKDAGDTNKKVKPKFNRSLFESTPKPKNEISDIESDFADADISNFTSVSDDEEEELKKALELSLKEYQDQEQEQLNFYKQDNVFKNENQSVDNTSNKNKQFTYNLVGIVNHHGINTSTGHYTSDTFNFKSKTWRNFNDSVVKDINEHEVRYGRAKSAYIVFYMLKSCFDEVLNGSC